MPRSGCAFCPETANLTGEHLWSDWIGSSLGRRGYTFTRTEADGTVKQWHGEELNSKARVACEHCNNGWMSDLEDKTKPILKEMILHATETELEPGELTLVAAVAFKNAVVADHMHENRPPFFTITERRTFAKKGIIPDGVQMWLSSMARQRGIFKSMTFQTKRGAPHGFEFNVFTYGVGHLVVQVATTRWTKRSRRRYEPPPFLTQSTEWDPVSVPFWPRAGTSTKWPPAGHLGDEIIDALVDRWKDLARGANFPRPF